MMNCAPLLSGRNAGSHSATDMAPSEDKIGIEKRVHDTPSMQVSVSSAPNSVQWKTAATEHPYHHRSPFSRRRGKIDIYYNKNRTCLPAYLPPPCTQVYACLPVYSTERPVLTLPLNCILLTHPLTHSLTIWLYIRPSCHLLLLITNSLPIFLHLPHHTYLPSHEPGSDRPPFSSHILVTQTTS